SLRLWDNATEKLLGEGKPQNGHGDVVCLTFSPDGKLVAAASSDKKIQVWDASTGQGKWTGLSPAESLVSLAFSYDGKTLAAVDAKALYLWDVVTGEFQPRCWKPGRRLSLVSFLPDGHTLAVACNPLTAEEHESCICLVEAATLKELGQV